MEEPKKGEDARKLPIPAHIIDVPLPLNGDSSPIQKDSGRKHLEDDIDNPRASVDELNDLVTQLQARGSEPKSNFESRNSALEEPKGLANPSEGYNSNQDKTLLQKTIEMKNYYQKVKHRI
jgi:hypothetical protein